MNQILNADSYKVSHFKQYPPGTTHVSSYVESRGGKFDSTVFFGLQAYLKEYLSKPITKNDIKEANHLLTAHGLPFNEDGWYRILSKHGGFMPVEISAILEGTVLPVRNVMCQVVNTDDESPWVTSYIETSMLRAIWYGTTVATLSWHCREIIRQYLRETADSLDGLPFKLHDFGARGVSSEESAALGGLAHLVNFQGTDTLSAIVAAAKYYDCEMAGFSIPAAEHSTVTAWGINSEAAAYQNMITQFGGNGLFAVVSDSYDLDNAVINIWGTQLKAQVINNGGTLVIRPDSGEPSEVVLTTIQNLMNEFGFVENSKGYKMLPDYLRVMQGDGINIDQLEVILSVLKANRISADNVTFGMGGGLLQQLDRDTMEFAMKANAVKINGSWQDVYKTSPGKPSKAGRLKLVNVDGKYSTIRADNESFAGIPDRLVPVWKSGELLVDQSLEEIRFRAVGEG